MSGQKDVLPDSRLRHISTPKATRFIAGVPYQPIYCANCGHDGGFVPEDNMKDCFYLCNDCYKKHGKIAGTMAVSDEVFFARVVEAQMDKYGRILSVEELLMQLDNSDSFISKLAKDRSNLTPTSKGV